MPVPKRQNNEIISNYEITLTAAKVQESGRLVKRLLQALTILYYRENRYSKCVSYLMELLPIIQETGSLDQLAFYHLKIAHTLIMDTGFVAAEDYLNQALEIYLKLDNKLGLACVYTEFGRLYRENGQIDHCMMYLMDAVSIFDKYPDQLTMANSLNYQQAYDAATDIFGGLLMNMKLTDEGSEMLSALLDRKKGVHDSTEITRLLQNIGAANCYTDPDKALQYFQEALDRAGKASDIQGYAIITSNMAICYETKQDYHKAIQLSQKALSIMEKNNLKRYCANTLNNLASTYLKMGDAKHARRHALQSLDLLVHEDILQYKQESYWLLCQSCKAEESYQEALDYLLKYCEINNKVFNQETALTLNSLQKKYEDTALRLAEIQKQFSLITDALKKSMEMNFIGVSNSIKKAYQQAIKVSSYPNTNVIITGESGVGKEIVARLIHYAGSSNKGPLIDVNCSAIIESLAESEFFGYTKGSFTGATGDRIGFIEAATGGTLFLDEIADTPLSLQAKFLRVLETRSLKKIGSNKPVKVDFRLISATNRNILDMVNQGTFRSDLLYRINTIEIHIPPLRERKDDIEPLLSYFLKEFAQMMNKPVPHYSPHLLEQLCAYEFPGNVRELKNMVERAMIVIEGNELLLCDMGFPFISNRQECIASKAIRPIKQIEIDVILQALKKTGGNYTQASKMLGISYSTIKRKMKAASLRQE